MNRVIINLDLLNHNFQRVNDWIKRHGGSWTLVTKVLCGHSDTLKALQQLGVQSMGDSRLSNIMAIERIVPDFEAWYLRLPHISVLKDVVSMTDVSLNSEIEVIEGLNVEAKKQDKIHRVIIMIELGDLREGVRHCQKFCVNRFLSFSYLWLSPLRRGEIFADIIMGSSPQNGSKTDGSRDSSRG